MARGNAWQRWQRNLRYGGLNVVRIGPWPTAVRIPLRERLSLHPEKTRVVQFGRGRKRLRKPDRHRFYSSGGFGVFATFLSWATASRMPPKEATARRKTFIRARFSVRTRDLLLAAGRVLV